MRRFNLAQALHGQKVCTKEGNRVILDKFVVGVEYPLIGHIMVGDDLHLNSWTITGRDLAGFKSNDDLMMVTRHENT